MASDDLRGLPLPIMNPRRLPEDAFSIDLYLGKVEKVYQYVYDSYFGEGRSVYAAA
jgi:hypothetical protein